METKKKKYVDGMFIKEKETQYGSLLNVAISGAGLELLLQNTNKTGYVNLTVFKKKEKDQFGNTHYAIFNEYVPNNNATKQVVKEEEVKPDFGDDDLPF